MAICASPSAILPLGEAHDAGVFLVLVVVLVVDGLSLDLFVFQEQLATYVDEDGVNVC